MTIGEATFGVNISKAISLLDVDVLLGFVLKQPREYLYMHPEKILTKTQEATFKTLVKRRIAGEPIAYLVGSKEFYGRDFIVTPDVLIPRPDTELLVDTTLELLRQKKQPQTILDLGTGSGIIPITLALETTDKKHTVLGSDISAAAVKIARKNTKALQAPVTFFTSNLLAGIPDKYKGKLDIITFNAPYLTKTEARKQNLAFEPQVALTPTGSPTSLYEAMLAEAPNWLAPHGVILFEIGHRQAKQVSALCKAYFPHSKITIYKDYGGYDRVVQCQTES